jgi:hypothetical protein
MKLRAKFWYLWRFSSLEVGLEIDFRISGHEIQVVVQISEVDVGGLAEVEVEDVVLEGSGRPAGKTQS